MPPLSKRIARAFAVVEHRAGVSLRPLAYLDDRTHVHLGRISAIARAGRATTHFQHTGVTTLPDGVTMHIPLFCDRPDSTVAGVFTNRTYLRLLFMRCNCYRYPTTAKRYIFVLKSIRKKKLQIINRSSYRN